MISITQEQKTAFLKYIKEFNKWNDTEEGKQNITDHRDHQKFFQDKLSKSSLQSMDLDTFKAVYSKLWASNMFSNKDWYIENRLLKPNDGLEPIKKELTKLLYGENKPVSERYNEFKKNTKGLGSSALTEILHFVFPNKFCLWNEKPKTVIPFLGLDNLLQEKVFKQQISDGKEYEECNNLMTLLKDELVKSGVRDADFINLDCYIWFIFLKIYPESERIAEAGVSKVEEDKKASYKVRIETHEQAEFYLLKLGEMMGFMTYTCDKSKEADGIKLEDVAIVKELPPFAGENYMVSARTIDVIWFDDDESPKYCFEVEHTTDVSKSLNRIYQLKTFHVEFFVVASEDKRSKFILEMGKLPYRIDKERYHFISYDELIELHQNGKAFFELKDRLFG